VGGLFFGRLYGILVVDVLWGLVVVGRATIAKGRVEDVVFAF
jgi:hypothetical protein